MEDVERMTPAELRRRLAEFGLPLMPITASTRGLMVKKLKHLMAQPARAGLARYSSGEDSDQEPMPPPAAPRRSRAPAPPAPGPAAAPAPAPAAVPAPPGPRRRRAPRDDYETGSDSELEAAPRPIPSPAAYSGLSVSDNLNTIRSRLGLSQARPDYKPLDLDNIDSPYLSNFTRKLTALKADQRDRFDTSDITNGNDSNISKSYGTSYPRRTDPSPDFRKAGEKNVLKNNLVSLSIVGIGIVFFLVLSFVYVGMKSDVPFNPEDERNIIPICPANTAKRPSIDCILRNEVSNAVDFLKIIYSKLSNRALNARCNIGEEPAHMTDLEICKSMGEAYADRNHERDLHNAQVLIANNPKWGLSIVQLVESDSTLVETVLTSMEYVAPMRKKNRTGLIVGNPSIPLTCLIYDKLSWFLSAFVLVLGLSVVGFLTQKTVKIFLARRKRRRDEIYSTVERIVDFLARENDDDPTRPGRSIPVSHVRDILVAPQDRDKTAATWDAALEFIEKNESRVRFETESVDGEEYQSLRWVSSRGSPKPTRGGARAWQGQAFETQEGSVNNLPFSPTQCLKIRHMVDKNDKNPNLKTTIKDAILEKCGPQCKILHIEIDKVSCCVFVKCASPADAGTVYQNLHGWWYEGNLITVKYLRLERYMDHFPSSSSVGPPYLKPSNQ